MHTATIVIVLFIVAVGWLWWQASRTIPTPPMPIPPHSEQAEVLFRRLASSFSKDSRVSNLIPSFAYAPVPTTGSYNATVGFPAFTGSHTALTGRSAVVPMTTGKNNVLIGIQPRGPETPAEWSAWINTWVTRHPKFTLVKPVTPEIMQKAFDWACEQKCNLQKTLDGWRTFLAQHDPTECPHGGGCYNLCIGLHACQSSTYTTDHSRMIWIDP